jgi:DNA-binding SARP family transcriptional activator/tetratricopeptide (TPR) repeat protein
MWVAGAAEPHALEPKLAAMLAILALEGATSRATLAERLWPEPDAKDRRSNLRSRLLALKKAAGRPVAAGEEVLHLEPGVEHDLAWIRDGTRPPEGLSRKVLLGQISYGGLGALERWVEHARERVRAAIRRQCDAVVQRLADLGQFDAALEVASILLLEEPAVEHAYFRVAQLHHRRGDRAGARAVIDRCHSALAAQGRRPVGLLRDLAARIAGSDVIANLPPAQLPAALTRPPAMAGRDPEKARIQTAWRSGQIVLLEGEPGVGKSRLIAELSGHPNRTLIVRAAGSDLDESYGLLKRVVRALVASFPAPYDAWALAELARVVPDLGPASQLPMQTARFVDALKHFLARACSNGLVLIQLDDLQWADASSLEAVLQQLDCADHAGLRWLLAWRLREQPTSLDAWLTRHGERVERVTLEPLDRGGVEALMQTLKDAMGLERMNPLAWAVALWPRTLGSPMHVLEDLIALWLERGDVALSRPIPDLRRRPASASLSLLMDQRLARLSEAAQRLARLAALADGVFSVALAETVLSAFALDLSTSWRELERAMVLRDCRFAHDLLRERTLGAIPAAVAKEMHGRIARAAADLQEPAGLVAKHWMLAERYNDAAAGFERTALQAKALNLRREELAAWDRTADCHDLDGAGEAAFEARCNAIEASLLVEDPTTSRARAAQLGRAARSTLQEFDAALAAAWVASKSHDLGPWMQATHRTMDLLAAARQAAAPLPWRKEFYSVCLHCSGLALEGRPQAALSMLELYAEQAESSADVSVRLEYLDTLGYLNTLVGRYRESVAALSRALAIAEQVDDWAEAMRLASNLAAPVSRSGNYRGALELVQKAMSLKARLGDPERMKGRLEMNLGHMHFRLARYDLAIAAWEQSIQAFRDNGEDRFRSGTETNLGALYLELGDGARAAEVLSPWPAAVEINRALRTLLLLRIEAWQGRDILRELQRMSPLFDKEQLGNRMVYRLTLARHLAPDDAVSACLELATESRAVEFTAAAQSADVIRVNALRQLGRFDEAAQVIDDVLVDVEQRQPFEMQLAEVWWVAYCLFDASGRPADAQAALTRGIDWLDSAVLPHVPRDMDNCFRTANPVAAGLLQAARQALPAPGP